ncbi:zinc ribbon domain-containing protein [Desulfosarcina sp.]|uniref:zinc ribbon domain-containing protein n=1 Tax=Desulfosarcina sp. TaxID=2027861 RepID=UPI003970B2CF
MAVDREDATSGILNALLFHMPTDVNAIAWSARLLLLAILTLWGIKFILSPIASDAAMSSFWHLVNLPFHEAGHIFFRPFGRVMTSLGGSLMQVLMPAICLLVFLIKTRDPFAGSFALWWMGQNFIDLAPYINDARSLRMPLLGGNVGSHSPYGFHDWEFILKETGLIRFDHTIARLSHVVGAVLIATALFWGGFLLFKHYQILRTRSPQ